MLLCKPFSRLLVTTPHRGVCFTNEATFLPVSGGSIFNGLQETNKIMCFFLCTLIELPLAVLCFAGEATFLPTPGGTAEDDGVLLSLVMARTGKSFMLVLDASSMLELARAELPYAVPYRFHGGFLPEHAQK